MKTFGTYILLVLFISITANVFAQDDPFAVKKVADEIVLVSGIETGSYHVIANDMIKVSSTPVKELTSSGSIDNYNMLINNPDIDIAFMQYDVLQAAKMHDYKAKQHVSDNIRVLLPLAVEDIHLITRTNSKILSIADLKDKKVGVGIPSKEGTNVTAGLIKSVTGIQWVDVEVSFDTAFAKLINGEIDALFFVGYAPVNKLKELMPTFNQIIRLVPIKDERLSRFHVKTIIPAGTYPWLYYDLETYGVRSILAVNKQFYSPEDQKKYEKFIKDLQEKLPMLQEEGHPKWKEVTFKFSGINWPIDPAAKSVFKLK